MWQLDQGREKFKEDPRWQTLKFETKLYLLANIQDNRRNCRLIHMLDAEASARMTPFDYAVGLMSILVSLALADVAASLHKLLRRARSVRWDGRVLLSVVFVITLLTGEWFSMWTIRTVKECFRSRFS